ncbi:MAG: MFS transporter [Actinomycetota bacterium]
MRLLRDRSFALLTLGHAVNGIGSWAALIAMWGYAAYRFDSGPADIAILALSWAVPAAIIGPLAGVPIDRLGPRRVLIGADLLGATASVLMIFAGSYELLVAFGVLHGLAKAFSYPAADALPPRLVADADLLRANAILGAASESAIVFGPLVAAGAIALWGLKAAFLLDALTYLVGVAVVLPLRLGELPSDDEPPAERRKLRAELAEGVALASRLRGVRYTLLLGIPVYLSWGAFAVVEPVYVRDVLGRSPTFFAMLQVAFGVGLVLTGLLLPRLGERVVSPASLAASVMLSGLTAALYVGTAIPAFAFAGVFLWGVDVAFFSAPSRTLLQRYAPVEAHGRVLALNRSLHSWSDLVALPLTGFAAGVVGVQAAALSFAAVALVAGTFGLSRSRSVLAGDLVGDDVHLGLVGLDLDLAPLAPEPSA